MSKPHTYITNTSSLFQDDVDDETFVESFRTRIPPPQPKPATVGSGGQIGELERQRQLHLEKQRDIERRTLDSAFRSNALLRESEDIGIATAEELAHQREQLQNTNKRLDDINTNLQMSQKHLNGIKSVFYGLKNYISGKSDQQPRTQTPPSSRSGPSSSRLADTIDTMSVKTAGESFSSHPTARLRGLDEQRFAEPITDSQRVNKLLDDNLDEMVISITRLKGLGHALGEEIDKQNDLIDRIHDKVEVADIKIGKQNTQMNKLLGK